MNNTPKIPKQLENEEQVNVRDFKPPTATFNRDELLLILARFHNVKQTKTWKSWDAYMNSSKTAPFPLSNELLDIVLADEEMGLQTKDEKWTAVMNMAGQTLATYQQKFNVSAIDAKNLLKEEIAKLTIINTFKIYQHLFQGTLAEYNRLKKDVELKDKVKLLSSDRIMRVFGSWTEARRLIAGVDEAYKMGRNNTYTDEQLIEILKEHGTKYYTLAEMQEDFKNLKLPSVSTFYNRLGKETVRLYTPNLSMQWHSNSTTENRAE